MIFEFETLFREIEDPVAVIDHTRKICATNPAFERTFGAYGKLENGLDSLLADPADISSAPWNNQTPSSEPQLRVLKRQDGELLRAQLRLHAGGDGHAFVVFKAYDPALAPERHSTANHHASLSSQFVGTFDLDLATLQLRIGGILARLLGFESREGVIQYQDWLNLVHRDERDDTNGVLLGLESTQASPIRLTLRTRDHAKGSYLTLRYELETTASDEDTKRIRLQGTVRDVSEQTRMERSLKLAEDMRERVIDLAGLSHWVYDFEAHSGEISGSDPSHLPFGPRFGPTIWRGLVHHEDASRLNAAFDALEFGLALDCTFRLRDEDGNWVDHRIVGSPELGASGKTQRAFGVLTSAQAQKEVCKTCLERSETDTSVNLTSWSSNVETRQISLTGPLVAKLGYLGDEITLDVDRWMAHVHPDDRDIAEGARHTAQHNMLVLEDYRLITDNDEIIWITDRGEISQQSSTGAPLVYSGVICELSTSEVLEKELASRERQWANAADAAVLGVWTLPRSGDLTVVRGRILDWFGRSQGDEEFTANDLLRIVHREDLEPGLEAVRAMFEDGRALDIKVRVDGPEGWHWIRIVGNILETDRDGRAQLASGIYVDIDAEVRAAAPKHSSSAPLESVYRNTPALLLSTDKTGKITLVSDQWLAHFGYWRDAVIGRDLSEFLTASPQNDRLNECLQASIAEAGLSDIELIAQTRAGAEIEIECAAYWVFDNEGQADHNYMVWTDVTARNAAQRSLQAHVEKLERANRELNRFTTVASHDLQEPLRKISAFSSLLKRKYEGQFDPDADRSLSYLIDATARMRAMIDDLLDYSKASYRDVVCTRVDLQSIWDEAIKTVSVSLEDIDAKLSVEPISDVLGDQMLLRIVLNNILSNAIKYRGHDRPLEITVTQRQIGDDVEICFADNGIGIDPKFAEKIFEPFARLHTRETYQGNGIGLAICQQALERMGGRIWAEGQSDIGTKFYISLPRYCSEDAQDWVA